MRKTENESSYWEAIRTHWAEMDEQSRIAFLRSHSDDEILAFSANQEISDASVDQIKQTLKRKTAAEQAGAVTLHANTLGFVGLAALQLASLLLGLKGMSIPVMPFGYADYAIYAVLCAINAASNAAEISEMNHQINQKNEAQKDDASTVKTQLITETETDVAKKISALKKKRAIQIGILSALLAGAAAFLVTSPDTHLLPAAASTAAATPASLALGFVFVGIMSTLAVLELKLAAQAEKNAAKLKESLDTKISEYETMMNLSNSRSNDPEPVEKCKQEINALTNLLHFEKCRATQHKINAALWAGTAASIAGSTTFMLLVVLGVSIAGGAVTMGAVPAAFALACALTACWRWYRTTHPTKIEPIKQSSDTPLTSKELNELTNKKGLFDFFPSKETNQQKIDSDSYANGH